MTVKELKEQLENIDGDLPVLFEGEFGYFETWMVWHRQDKIVITGKTLAEDDL